MAIITRHHALRLIRAGKATANGIVYDNNTNQTPEWVCVDRHDLCRVDHYRFTPADERIVRPVTADNLPLNR